MTDKPVRVLPACALTASYAGFVSLQWLRDRDLVVLLFVSFFTLNMFS